MPIEELSLCLFLMFIFVFGIKLGYEIGKDNTLSWVIKELRTGLAKELIEIDKKTRKAERNDD